MSDKKEAKPILYIPYSEWNHRLDTDGDVDSQGRVVVCLEFAQSHAEKEAAIATKH